MEASDNTCIVWPLGESYSDIFGWGFSAPDNQAAAKESRPADIGGLGSCWKP
jgi:hypothetical protein